MCANFDQYIPPNRIRLEITNKIKNNLSSHLLFKSNDCKNDQIKPNKEDAISASTNRSAWTILYQGWASEYTSTLKKNQNQDPPKTVINAPTCQITGHTDGVLEDGEL